MIPDTALASVDEVVALTREAGRVERSHTTFHLGSDPNGLHSYNVANLILLLHPDPSIDLLRAALWHDVPERFTGDMPSTFKRQCPEVRAAMKAAEAQIEHHYGLDIPLCDAEKAWLKAADKLEFYLWAEEQAAMGNAYIAPKRDQARAELLSAECIPPAVREFVQDYHFEPVKSCWAERVTPARNGYLRA